jgi:DNA-binding transcriptional LysR family regulator
MNRTGISELEIMLAVARRGSFSGAASELEISPSAVTNAVAGLEKRLGVRLFNRTTRSVGLTEAGQRFMVKIAPAVEVIRSASAEIASLPADPAGSLRINVPPASCALWYDEILLPFLARYPRIRADIHSQKDKVDIIAAGFDAGIRLADDIPADMIPVKLTPPLRMILVASPDYLSHAGTPQQPEDLSAHRCICMRMADGSIYRWELSHQQQSHKVQVEPLLIVNDLASAQKAVVGGLGIACLSERHIAADVLAGRVIQLMPEWQVNLGALCLYYPGHRLVPPALKALTEFIREVRGACDL